VTKEKLMSRIAALIASVTDDLETEIVELPKWGVTIQVRGLDGVHRSEFQARIAAAREESDENDPTTISAVEKALLVESCFDPEDGSQCFDESDVEMLWTKNGAYIGKLVTAAMKVSGLSQDVENAMGKTSSDSSPTLPAESTSTQNDASTSI
jgi:hypothetical protein